MTFRAAVLSNLFVILSVLPVAASSDTSHFTKTEPRPGLSLEIPSHWKILPPADVSNLASMSEAIRKNSDAPDPDYQKKRLLAVSSTPSPSGATIRVNELSPDPLTQDMLKNATNIELSEVRDHIYKSMKSLESHGGPIIISMEPVTIEEISKLKAMVLSYKRKGVGGDSSPWQVFQYSVPTKGRTVQITLSYRITDDIVWKPILDRVKRSVTIK
jgi:hypothetical protein